jgi:integrase
MIGLHVNAELAQMALSDVTSGTLNELYAERLHNGRRRGSGGLAPRTVRYLHTILNRAFADAIRAGHLLANPAAAAHAPSARATRSTVFSVWSPSELARFLETARTNPNYVAFHLAAATGLRRGEVLGLRWCDVDEEARQLHVVQSVVEIAHVPTIMPPKTDRSRRSVALDAVTAELFMRHRTEAKACDPQLDERTLIFCKSNGEPMHPGLFIYHFQMCVRRAGVRRIRFHDLRHTHATHALQLGIHPKIVSERLGHSTITVTLDTYSHVLPSMQQEAAEAIAALVHG